MSNSFGIIGGLRPTLPGRFEALLDDNPLAPSIILTRPNGRKRVWARAAIEHRAVRIGAYCASVGLPVGARVKIHARGALNVLSGIFFILASGRILAHQGPTDLTLDELILANLASISGSYTLRNIALPSEQAVAVGDRCIDHACLLDEVENKVPLPISQLCTHALYHLATGEPIELIGENMIAGEIVAA